MRQYFFTSTESHKVSESSLSFRANSIFTTQDRIYSDGNPVTSSSHPSSVNAPEGLSSISHNGITISINDTVELENGQFLRIKHMVSQFAPQTSRKLVLSGLLFERTKYHSIPVRFTNEVTLLLNIESRRVSCDDAIGSIDSISRGLVERPLSDVIQKRDLIVTAASYPMHSTNPSIYKNKGKGLTGEIGTLCCRFVVAKIHHAMSHKYPHEGFIRRIREEESDDACSVVCRYDCPCHLPIDYEAMAFKPITYGSAFCGAGGDSCGAKIAGAKLVFAFDQDSDAIKTMRTNNPDAEGNIDIYQIEDHYFANEFDLPARIEPQIYHCSFPCQDDSPANCVGEANPNFGDKRDLKTSIVHHLQKVRPLIHTQENTFGISTRERSYAFLQVMIQEIVSCGYNVRWNILNFKIYGVPQNRQRFVLIAARHNLPLPDYPRAIYGPPNGALAPYRTIGDALEGFDDRPFRNRMSKKTGPAYDAFTAMSPCLTTSGTTNLHPSGTRSFLLQELALLQTFPSTYQFEGNIKKSGSTQVGNAVPPLACKYVIAEIISCLRKFSREKIERLQHGFGNDDDDSMHDWMANLGVEEIENEIKADLELVGALSRSSPCTIIEASAPENPALPANKRKLEEEGGGEGSFRQKCVKFNKPRVTSNEGASVTISVRNDIIDLTGDGDSAPVKQKSSNNNSQQIVIDLTIEE